MTTRETPAASLARQRRLLQLECEQERDAHRHLTEAMGIDRLVRRGDCRFPVTVGRTYYNSLNRLAVEVSWSDGGDDEDDHNFEYGSHVSFFTVAGNGEMRYLSAPATVSYAEARRMVVIVDNERQAAEIAASPRPGVQMAFDERTYRLMNEALDRVSSARGTRLAALRDLFYGLGKPAEFSFAAIALPWLNDSQQQAVNAVLRAKDVAVVHGPPGTGKTTTLVEAIHETLRRETQVLVCAQSNMAVDWISEQLADRGIDVLRVGNPTRVTDRMLALTYERRYEDHPDYPRLWALRKALREVRGRGEARHAAVERLKDRITALELTIHNDLISHARVVACTLAGSANHVLDGMRFATLFIDEAAQALEAAAWIAIARCQRVVLAGDHCQLPPTVKSLEALRGGLDYTLMQRIVDNQPATVTLLRVQYRMHDDIARFPSRRFYGGQVVSAPEVRHRGILDLDTAITWIDTGEPGNDEVLEQEVAATAGRINRAEARLTLDTLQAYLERIGRHRVLDESLDTGIISPYRAQVQYLRQLLRQRDYFKPLRRLVSINTVDGFQGQERDIIVLSLVRANDEGQIGFLRDLRRINVAITRARMKLIILGHADTLTRHPFYRDLYRYVRWLNGFFDANPA